MHARSAAPRLARLVPAALCAALALVPQLPAQAGGDTDQPGAARAASSAPRHPPADPRSDDPASWPGDPIPPGEMLHETPSGLRYAVLRLGTGERPASAFDEVEVHYTGWLPDGTQFDSSVGGDPVRFPLNNVIPGWTEGVLLMPVGSKLKFVIPHELGYGERGSPPRIPARATLVFDVELRAITRRVELPAFEHPDPERCQPIGDGIIGYVVDPASAVRGDDGEVRWNDRLEVHYTSWLEDGTVIESTYVRDDPVKLSCAAVPVPGLAAAIDSLREGETGRFVVPARMAYGEGGWPGRVPPGANVIYEIEVLSREAGPDPLPLPAFRLPADDELTTTASGLQYLVLAEGEGAAPGPSDTVSVHYAGWFTDGLLFDASYKRGSPAVFPLDRVIPGWTEGVQLMRPGGSCLFVIPGKLAYGEAGRPPKIPPDATLVFRIDLLEVQ